jgi:hypothetical protein
MNAVRPRRPPNRPRRRWLLPAFLLLALAGVLVGLFFLPGPVPRPVVVAVAVSQYADPAWPPNPFADADAAGFAARFDHPYSPREAQTRAGLVGKLTDAVREARGGGRPLLVYLCALGTVTADGPHLLPADAVPDDPATWLPLADVLQPLRETTANTLLVLDVRPARAPFVAFPTADVNERIDADLAALTDRNELPFRVFTANAPPAGPPVFAPLRRSAFGLAIEHAAGGAADGWSAGGRKDDHVTTDEFIAHATATTAAVSRAVDSLYERATHTPRVHGAGRDFRLTTVPRGGSAGLPELPAKFDDYPTDLTAAWKRADNAVRDDYHLRVPGRVRPFLAAAVRAEQRWLAGYGGEVAAQTLALTTRFDEAARTGSAVRPAAVSVARAAGGKSLADHGRAARTALRAAFELIAEQPKTANDDLKAVLAKAFADKPPPFDEVAAAVLTAARDLPDPKPDQLRQLVRVAAAHPDKTPLAELATLELIAGLPARLYRDWPKGAVRRAIDAAVLAEQAAAFDPRDRERVTDAIRDADGLRMTALVALCDPNAKAAAMDAAPGQFDAACDRYEKQNETLRRFRKARTELESARADLNDLPTGLPSDLGLSPENWEQKVVRLVDAYVEVVKSVRSAPNQPADDLDARTATLHDRWNEVRKVRTVPPTPVTVRGLEQTLRWPWWSEADRKKHRDSWVAASVEVSRVALVAVPTTVVTAPSPSPKSGGRVLDESVCLARIALALIRAGEAPTEVKKTAELEAALRAKLNPDPAEFTRLVKQVHALSARANGGNPDADLTAHRIAQSEFDRWLQTERYRPAAAAFEKIPLDTGFTPARSLREVADRCR